MARACVRQTLSIALVPLHHKWSLLGTALHSVTPPLIPPGLATRRCDNERYVRDLRLPAAAAAAEAACENTPNSKMTRSVYMRWYVALAMRISLHYGSRREMCPISIGSSRMTSLNAVLRRCTTAEINDDDQRFLFGEVTTLVTWRMGRRTCRRVPVDRLKLIGSIQIFDH